MGNLRRGDGSPGVRLVRDQMRFSKVCGVLAALLCAHLVVASTSELPGDPLPNAATPTTALGALHDTLKQSLQQERQVAKSSEQALTKQIKQVKKGKQPSAVEDDTLATLAKIRGTAQRQAKKFRSSLSAQQKLEDGKLQKSERKVNRVVSNALKSKNTNRV